MTTSWRRPLVAFYWTKHRHLQKMFKKRIAAASWKKTYWSSNENVFELGGYHFLKRSFVYSTWRSWKNIYWNTPCSEEAATFRFLICSKLWRIFLEIFHLFNVWPKSLTDGEIWGLNKNKTFYFQRVLSLKARRNKIEQFYADGPSRETFTAAKNIFIAIVKKNLNSVWCRFMKKFGRFCFRI